MVRRLLGDAGVETVDADSVGHAVLEPGGPAFAAVSARWPTVVVDGAIDRQRLATIVFEDAAELAELESITHPHIFDLIRTRVEGIDGLVAVEVPVLSDALGPGWRRMVVDSRDEIRLRRAIGRGMTEADARARMAAQPARERWLAAADLVIPNHGSEVELEEAVARLVGLL
jgi:dephospho-CoA kinase